MLDFHSNSEMVLKALHDVNKCFKHIIYGDILKKRFIIFIYNKNEFEISIYFVKNRLLITDDKIP